MIIDFKEIPTANSGAGNQDTFEMFSRDFLKLIGYEIIGEPSRGADGGIDIKVKEVRNGIGGTNDFFWLVSCKHYAHSQSAISPSIENNILDRVMSNQCDGFLGFYSNISTTGLKDILAGLSNKISYQIFDNEKIESQIVGISKMENLFIRYFPESYKKWKEVYYYLEPVKLFEHYFLGKYNDSKNIYEALFGSLGNSIKFIRKFDSFEAAIIANSKKILLEPELWGYCEASKKMEYEDVSFYSIFTLDKHLPNEISHKYNIEIHEKLLSAAINFEIMGAIVLYPDYLIVDKPYLDYLSTIYLDLREAIK